MSERPAAHVRQLINKLKLETEWPKCERFKKADYLTDVDPLIALANKKGHSHLSQFARALVTVILEDDEPYEDYIVVDRDYTVGKEWPDIVDAGVWALVREHYKKNKPVGSKTK